jgi:hypothetical protein
MANPNWKPGVSGNPAGRKPGSINKRSNEELWHRLEARGDLDPGDVLSGIASDLAERKELRIAAANGLMQYKYSKRGLSSEPPPLVYIETPIELPHPHVTAIEHVIANIEHVSQLRCTGKLDQDTADRLVGEQRVLRDAVIEAAKIEAEHGPRDATIRIEGGLPPLPLGDGVAQIIMPELNGHAGPTIDGLPGPVDPNPDAS